MTTPHVGAELSYLLSSVGETIWTIQRLHCRFPRIKKYNSAFRAGNYEHNVGHLTVEIVRQNWSSEVISLFCRRLGGWAGGTMQPTCQWTFYAKK